MVHRYCTATALLLVIVASVAFAQAPAAPPTPPGQTTLDAESSLTVFLNGSPIGLEQVRVTASASGWLVKGTGRLGVPINMTTSRFEATYDRDWQPLSLEVDASLRGQPLVLRTKFSGGMAHNELMQAGQQTLKDDKHSPKALILPNTFFGSYEAMALRLTGASVGLEIPVYVAPQVEVMARVTAIAEERIQLPGQILISKRHHLTFTNPTGPIEVEVWTDAHSRLLRLRVPTQGLEVSRTDIASVSARVERGTRLGDEIVHIPANGFSLAATISRPRNAPPPQKKGYKGPRLPVVVLVPGSGQVDRDVLVSGIPIFAQLANGVADAGLMVVRYDKRGVGQSGGRDESVTIDDYAEDVRAIISYLRKRNDVNDKQVFLAGHSEGGMVSMLAASKEGDHLAGLVLLSTPATTGAELVLEQQRHILEQLPLPENERRSRMELQQKIQKAVIDGSSWDDIPSGFRRQADTPWFRSFLLFDPAKVISKTEQPLFVIQTERDRQVPVTHGHKLLEMGKARKTKANTTLVIVDGLNHLLAPAPTGEVAEYQTLADKNVSPLVIEHLAKWLTQALAPVRKN